MSKSLSILLPTYNCICTALVGELQRQCVAEGADFEIIVADDASPDKRFIAENRAIARLDGVRYIERERNVGRSAIRNYLVSQSSKEWILFIDGDLSLNNAQFIHNYLQAEGDVVVGGISIVEDKKQMGQQPQIPLRARFKRSYQCRKPKKNTLSAPQHQLYGAPKAGRHNPLQRANKALRL